MFVIEFAKLTFNVRQILKGDFFVLKVPKLLISANENCLFILNVYLNQ